MTGTASRIALLAVAIAVLSASLAAAQSLEGNLPELVRLYELQKKNRSRYQRGEITAKVEERLSGFSAEVTVIWDGAKTYWEGTSTESIPLGGGELRQLPARTFRMIEDGNKHFYYWPNDRLAQRVVSENSGYHDELQLRPDQCWFAFERAVPWTEFLDPDLLGSDLQYARIYEQAPGQIVFDRHGVKGGVFTIEMSAEFGGNILAYDGVPGEDTVSTTCSGRYTWARCDDDPELWYPKSYTYFIIRPDTKTYTRNYSLEVHSFKSKPEIAKNRFEFESFEIPDGTFVDDVNGKLRKRHRHVQQPANKSEPGA